jgi:hypothetical protein
MATQLAPHHPVTWAPPRPLWWGGEPGVRAPQILRFASDDFMDQMLSVLEEEPARIGERIARPETWRTPAAELAATDLIQRVPIPSPASQAKRQRLLAQPGFAPLKPGTDQPLKLYQPAHQRYYLVSASLACQLPGLPERSLTGGHESVHFVIRRLMPASAAAGADPNPVEYAHVRQGDDAQWQRVGTDFAVLAPGEELLPLFPLAHRDEQGRPRTLWSGLVPVGRREAYLAKPVNRTAVSLAEGQRLALRPGAPAPASLSRMARTTQLRMDVSEPWKAMIRSAVKAQAEGLGPAAPTAAQGLRRILDYDLAYQMQSWLILLDLADWIAIELPRLWTAIVGNSAAGLTAAEANALAWLNTAVATPLQAAMRDPAAPGTDLKDLAASLRDALAKVRTAANRALIEGATTHYAFAAATADKARWPAFHFPLAGLTTAGVAFAPLGDQTKLGLVDPEPVIAIPLAIPPASAPDVAETIDKVTSMLARLLPVTDEATTRPLPFAMKLRDVMVQTAGDPGLFVIRMVHLNADCGPLHPPTLSEPTARFRLASFFDSDAPVRPLRITLPSDTSPAGLRKHGRGTAFVMSDLLCGQVQRAKGLGFVDLVRQVLPWPLHKDIDVGSGGGCKDGGGGEIGMICSLSIPIITLCALILLMIIVTLLDFIFRWLPWFVACFPVPGLKGKST